MRGRRYRENILWRYIDIKGWNRRKRRGGRLNDEKNRKEKR